MNSIFLEVGGNGIFGTLNYERMINSKMGLRVGGIFLPFSDTEHPLFGTLMINWILGKDNLRMEIGQGIFIYGGGWEEFSHSGSIFFTATIGIRYQPKIKGIILRLGFTPLFGPDRVYPWAGASIGYSFR
jgi:hypothetical protein